MYNKRKFQKLNDKKVLHKVGKRWVTISVALLSLLGGGLALNKVTIHAAANDDADSNRSLQGVNQHFNAPQILNNRGRQNQFQSSHNVSTADVQQRSNRLYSQIYHHALLNGALNRSVRKPINGDQSNRPINLTANDRPVRKIQSINSLKAHQYGNYHNELVSRIQLPFNRIRVDKKLQVHRSFNFQDHNPQIINVGRIFKVLKAFKGYGHYSNYLRYEVRLGQQNRSAFITGNSDYVSFMAPSRRYTYYQRQLRHVLSHVTSRRLRGIRQGFRKLNRRHCKNYRRYMRLYVKAYALRQNLQYPLKVDYRSPLNKETSLPTSKSPQSSQSVSQSSANYMVSSLAQPSSIFTPVNFNFTPNNTLSSSTFQSLQFSQSSTGSIASSSQSSSTSTSGNSDKNTSDDIKSIKYVVSDRSADNNGQVIGTRSDLNNVADQVPAGYQIKSSNNSDVVKVGPIQKTDQITYVYNHKPISEYDRTKYNQQIAFSGNDVKAVGAGHTNFVIGSTPKGLDPRYQVDNPSQSFGYDGKSYTVAVTPKAADVKVVYHEPNGTNVTKTLMVNQLKNRMTGESDVIPSTKQSILPAVPAGYHLNGDNVTIRLSHPFYSTKNVVTIPLTSTPVTETIKYVYTDGAHHQHNENANTVSMRGLYGNSGLVSGDGLKAGWQLVNPQNSFTYGKNNDLDNVAVEPQSASATVDYVVNDSDAYSDGTVLYSYSQNGNDYRATDASDTSFIASRLPKGYQIKSGNSTIPYDNGLHTIFVEPAQKTDLINYKYNDQPINSYGNKYSKNAEFSGNDVNDKNVVYYTNFVIGSTPKGLDPRYHVDNPNQSFGYDGKSHTVAVTPKAADVIVTYRKPDGTKINKTLSVDQLNNQLTGDSDVITNSDSSVLPGMPIGYHLISNVDIKLTHPFYNAKNTVTVPLAGDSDTELIKYVYNNGSRTYDEGFTTLSGNNDNVGDEMNVTGLNPGWQLVNVNNPFTYGKNSDEMTVAVKPQRASARINYVVSDSHANNNGRKIGSDEQSGNDYRAVDAGNSSFSAGHVPAGYQIKPGQDTNVQYNNRTRTLKVAPIQKTDRITYVYNKKPIQGYDNVKYKDYADFSGNDVGAKGAGNSSFMIGSTPKGLDPRFHVDNPEQRLNYDGKSYQIEVTPEAADVNVNYREPNGTVITVVAPSKGQLTGTNDMISVDKPSMLSKIPSEYHVSEKQVSVKLNRPFYDTKNSVTVPLVGVPTDETIQYVYVDGENNQYSENGTTTIMHGQFGSQGHVNGQGLKPGWQLVNSDNSFTYGNGNDIDAVKVEPQRATATVKYIVSDSNALNNNQVIDSYEQDGNNYQASDAGNTEFTTNYCPNGYHIKPSQNLTFGYNDGSDVVKVEPDKTTDLITYVYDHKPIVNYGPKYDKQVQLSGNSTKAKGAGNFNFTVGETPKGLDPHYHVDKPNQLFSYDGKHHLVTVTPEAADVNVIYREPNGTKVTDSLPINRLSNRLVNESDTIPSTDLPTVPKGYHLANTNNIRVQLTHPFYDKNNNSINELLVGNPVMETIKYVYTDSTHHQHDENEHRVTIPGTFGSQGHVSGQGLKAGWQLVNANPSYVFGGNHATAVIAVKPLKANEVVNYIVSDGHAANNGHKVGSDKLSGNDYRAIDAGDNSFIAGNVPLGYQIKSGQKTQVFYSNGTAILKVVPIKKNATIEYDYNNNLITHYGRQYTNMNVFNGNDVNAVDAGNTSFTVAAKAGQLKLDPRYHVDDPDQKINYDGRTHQIAVTPEAANVTVTYQEPDGTKISEPLSVNRLTNRLTGESNVITPNDYGILPTIPNGYHLSGNHVTISLNNPFYDKNKNSVTVPLDGNPATERINYIYTDSRHHQHSEGMTIVNGFNDHVGDETNAVGLKAGWQLVNAHNRFIYGKNNNVTFVDVKPQTANATIDYMVSDKNAVNNNQKVGGYQQSGNNYQATDAGNNEFLADNVPVGYQIKPGQNTTVKYDNGVDVIRVEPVQANDVITYTYNNKPITNYNNVKYSKQATYSGNSVKAKGAGHTSFVIGETPKDLDPRYRVKNPNQSFNYDGMSHQVVVTPVAADVNVNYRDSNGINITKLLPVDQLRGSVTGNRDVITPVDDSMLSIQVGYHLSGNVMIELNNPFYGNKNTAIANVVPNTANVEYVYNDQPINHYVSGDSSTATYSVGTGDFPIGSTPDKLDSRFHVDDPSQKIAYNSGSYQKVRVTPESAAINVVYTFNGNRIGTQTISDRSLANGLVGQSTNVTSNLRVPAGYYNDNPASGNITLTNPFYSNDNQTVRIPVVKENSYDGLNYIDNNGNLTFVSGTMSSNGSDFLSSMPNNIKSASSITFNPGVKLNSDLSGMFQNDSDLKSVNMSGLNYADQITNMNSMFQNDSNLESVNLSNFNASKVSSMNSMFSGDNQLVSINLDNFKASGTLNMSMAFGSTKVKSLDLSGFNVNDPNLSGTFMFDSDLQSVNFGPSFDTSGNSDSNCFAVLESNYTMGANNALKTITIESPNTKFSSNADLPVMYKEIGKNDLQGKPYTLSTPNDFSKGNVGTFTSVKNPAPSTDHTVAVPKVSPQSQTDVDKIQFNGMNNMPNMVKEGTNGTQGQVSAPGGYHFINGSTGSFIFNNTTHQFEVAKDVPSADTSKSGSTNTSK